MAHYPIRCVYCLREIPDAEVKFSFADAIDDELDFIRRNTSQGPSVKISRDSEDVTTEGESDADDLFFDDDYEDDADSDDADTEMTDDAEDSRGMEQDEMLGMFFVRDLGEISWIKWYEPKTLNVPVSPEYRSNHAAEENLTLEVHFTNKAGEHKRVMRRYCPYCGNILPDQSGRMPTYVVTVLGTTSSGKTVYLTALHRLLTHVGVGNKRIPYTGQLQGTNVNMRSNQIAIFSDTMYSTGMLPGQTTEQLIDPVIFNLSFGTTGSNARRLKSCLLAMVDMRGEDLQGANATMLAMRHEMYRTSDAFLFIADPQNMPGFFGKVGDQNTSPDVHVRLKAQIMDHIASQFENNQVRKPTAVAITKVDKLIDNARALRLSPASRTVQYKRAARMRKTKEYFTHIDNETKTFMKNLDDNLLQFLSSVFPTATYTSVASLGSHPDIIELDELNAETGKPLLRVLNPDIMGAIRVEDPLMIILMGLGLLPPYNLISEDPSRHEENKKVIRKWMEGYV